MLLRRTFLTLALALTGSGALAAGTSVARPERYPARMLVYAQEWSLSPSRASLPAGKVVVQLWNRGMDAHDLRIRRLNGAGAMVGNTQGVKVTESGSLSSADWKLSPGRYEMYCSLPGHRMRGMHVTIRVRKG